MSTPPTVQADLRPRLRVAASEVMGYVVPLYCAPVPVKCRREWRNRQTRTVQVRVPERVWGFNSPLAHHRGSPVPSLTT